ncbi:PAS domain S-box protein [uncultured Draconibacterium sp.]|uniref:PAS domain S-box protein n=1 Tax=uncultured Draconibacterium sp. TaxID=1573823 RepID=UPI0029C70A57|nr:PAS domain S-box protein [uncultured Draconibacterium sp.]
MFQALIQNAALLITLSFLYGTIKYYFAQKKLQFQIISGVWFGIVAVAAMLLPYQHEPGVFYDGRSIVITLAGLWSGGLATLITMIVAGTYRAFLGGAGIWAGLATIVASGIIGLFFRTILQKELQKVHTVVLYAVGIISHLAMLASQRLLPEHPMQTIQQIWFPVMLIFPVALTLIAKLFQFIERYLSSEQQIRKAEEMYRTTLLSIGDAVICTDIKGRITQLNWEAERLTGWNAKDAYKKNLEDVFHIVNEHSREKVESPFSKVMEHGKVVGLANHTILLSKDGNEIPIADSGAPIIIHNQIVGVVLVFRDQTEDRIYQQALEESEARYRERDYWFTESQRVGNIGTYQFDISNNSWTSSIALDNIFGLDEKHSRTTESWITIIQPEYREQMMDYLLNEVIGNKQPFNKEYKIIRKSDGAERWVHGLGKLRYDEKENTVQMLGTIQDITERKLSQEQLVKSEERFRKAVLLAPIPIMVFDQHGNILYLSQGWKQLSGYTIDQMPTIKEWSEKVFPKTKAKDVEESLIEVVELDQTVFSGDYEITTHNGEKRIWNFHTSPLGESDGKKLALSIAPDITQRMLIKKELEASEQAYRQLFEEHIAVKLLINPENGQIVRANKAAADFYGYSVKKLEKMAITNINASANEPSEQAFAHDNNRKQYYLELKHRLRSGEIRDVEVFRNKIEYKGQIVWHSIIHDITEKKRLMQDLVDAKEKAEESERLKSAFLANVSHEIRTPLNGIVGFSNILAQEENINAANKREFADIINQSSSGLLKIIDDILDLSRLETGLVSFSVEPFQVNTMLNNLYSIFKNKMQNSPNTDVELIVHEADKSMMINGDDIRITQIISNLLENAIRFTKSGTIEFGVSNSDNTNLEFFVADTGIGIPPENQQRIFGRFMQAESGISRKYGGTGLGLSIVKKLLELMGSEIHMKSETGKGTKFWFKLPLYNKPLHDMIDKNQADKKLHSESLSSQYKVLVVEDNEDSRIFFKHVLSKKYPLLSFAITGNDALQQIQNNPPDIVLLDIGLPDISGLEVAKKIKQTNSKIKIIAQTAFASTSDKVNALEAGCDDFIVKPIRISSLLEKMKKKLAE